MGLPPNINRLFIANVASTSQSHFALLHQQFIIVNYYLHDSFEKRNIHKPVHVYPPPHTHTHSLPVETYDLYEL